MNKNEKTLHIEKNKYNNWYQKVKMENLKFITETTEFLKNPITKMEEIKTTDWGKKYHVVS